MTVGLISLLASEDERAESGKLNGEYNALKTVAKQQKCNFASKLELTTKGLGHYL